MAHLTAKLFARGPVVDISLDVSQARRLAIPSEANYPAVRVTRGLLDTGASRTCVDAGLLKSLNLSPSGTIDMFTSSTGNTPVRVPIFDLDISLLAASPTEEYLTFVNQSVMATNLAEGQGFQVLIGRDLLSRCLLVYNGKEKTVTLAY